MKGSHKATFFQGFQGGEYSQKVALSPRIQATSKKRDRQEGRALELATATLYTQKAHLAHVPNTSRANQSNAQLFGSQ
jgi:hypothetical protein